MNEINSIQDKINKINGSKFDAVEQKFCSCFSRNKGFKVIGEISCILEGEDLVDSEDLKDLSFSDFMCYKHVRLVSCDVELTN
jgi:hypothetical protein